MDDDGILIDSDGLAPVKPLQPKTGKRGRKQDNTLPPSRSRDVQRAFRARRAEKISNLEARVKYLEDENATLRAKLGLPEAEPWASGSGSPTTVPQLQPQRDGYANQFDAPAPAPADSKRWSTAPVPSAAEHEHAHTTSGYDPNFPSPSGASAAFAGLRPSDEQRAFLTTCCAVAPADLQPSTPYHLFCCTLMQALLVTGKGRSARMSLENPTLAPRDISATDAFEDSPPTDPIRPGYVTAFIAWSVLQTLQLQPVELATLLIGAAGGAGDGSPLGGGQGLRCEPNYGLVVSESAVKACKVHLEQQKAAQVPRPDFEVHAEYDPTNNFAFDPASVGGVSRVVDSWQ